MHCLYNVVIVIVVENKFQFNSICLVYSPPHRLTRYQDVHPHEERPPHRADRVPDGGGLPGLPGGRRRGQGHPRQVPVEGRGGQPRLVG